MRVQPSSLAGEMTMVPSKSQTLRAILFAGLARGESRIQRPLCSPDTTAMITAVQALGAQVKQVGADLVVQGVAGVLQPPVAPIDAGNSGLVLRLLAGVLANLTQPVVITGDVSIRSRRPVLPLLSGLSQWGVMARAVYGNDHAPIEVRGPLIGDRAATVAGADSQPISGLLIGSALAPGVQRLTVTAPGERPWIDLTLAWLARLGVRVQRDGYTHFVVPEQSVWSGFDYTVPGDWSSAAFPLVAALLTQSSVELTGLWPDEQGDQQLLAVLRSMGAKLTYDAEAGSLCVLPSGQLQGRCIDINSMIDALPILAVVGCFARGKTVLTGAAVARLKESDRIQTMCAALRKMGAVCGETADGLWVQESQLHWAQCDSANDHRIALALACAGLAAAGVHITQADCIAKTFADFVPLMQQMGAQVEWDDVTDTVRA